MKRMSAGCTMDSGGFVANEMALKITRAILIPDSFVP